MNKALSQSMLKQYFVREEAMRIVFPTSALDETDVLIDSRDDRTPIKESKGASLKLAHGGRWWSRG